MTPEEQAAAYAKKLCPYASENQPTDTERYVRAIAHNSYRDAATQHLSQLQQTGELLLQKDGKIEALESEVARLRGALEDVLAHCKAAGAPKFKDDWVLIEVSKIATKALNPTHEQPKMDTSNRPTASPGN